jgi:hypothetical protein
VKCFTQIYGPIPYFQCWRTTVGLRGRRTRDWRSKNTELLCKPAADGEGRRTLKAAAADFNRRQFFPRPGKHA